jgi:hypothetical protein
LRNRFRMISYPTFIRETFDYTMTGPTFLG